MNGVEKTCLICGGSGWVLNRENDRETALPCQCRRNDTQTLKVIGANIPIRFAWVELKAYFPDKNDPSQLRAKQMTEKFIHDYPAVVKGLLFQGATGVGKTRMLCSIANQLIADKDADVYYIDWNDLVREMKSGEDHSSRDFSNIDQLIGKLITVDLLLFDEMGASRPSPWVEDNIYYVINKRYNGNRITVFASNFFDQKINADEETLGQRLGERIRSRLFEMADIVEIRGLDYRERHG